MDKSNPTILMDAIVDIYASSLQFYSRLNRSFLDVLFVSFTDAREELRELRKEEAKNEKKVYSAHYGDYLKYQQDKFDINFREEGFTRALCEYIDSYSDIAKMTYAGQIYQHTSNFTSLWNNKFIEPIRDTILRTPSHEINSENRYSLFHYDIREVLDRHRKLSII